MLKFLSLPLLVLALLSPALAPAAEESAPMPAPAPAAQASQPQAASRKPQPAHVLQAVRLRPYADSLRLIFLFDRPAPYTLQEDLGAQRATLEFLNAALSSLPAELAQVKDPRLSGVWLKQHDSGLVTLELRFPTAAVRVEHFAMDDPAAVVIDIFRTDGEVARISAAPEETTLSVPPPPAATPEPQATPSPRPALPKTAAAVASGANGAVLPILAPTPRQSAPAVPLALAGTTSGTGAAPLVQTAPAAAHAPRNTAPAGTLAHGETDPLDADYDYFPLGTLRVTSPDALAIRDNFIARRWATVVRNGLQYIQKNKMNAETGDVLHMIAEANWQLAASRPEESMPDAMNMFQQALRVSSRGELGAFAASRLAAAAMLGRDYGTALGYLGRAATSAHEAVRRNASLMRIQALEAMHSFDEALGAIAAATTLTSAPAQLVNLHVKAGDILQAKGDYPAAWAAYQKAATLDPKWLNLYVKSGMSFVRTALETGHLEEARAAVLLTFSLYSDEEQVNLALLYAEVLRRLGKLDAAEDAYYSALRDIENKPNGPEVLQRMYKDYPAEFLAGENRYILLFLQTGHIRQSMTELNHAYETARREGLPTAKLEEAFQAVLPIFMEQALRENHPFEAIDAWKAYHHLARTVAQRRRCLAPLAHALEMISLYDDALKVVRELREDASTSDTLAPGGLNIQEARLLLKAGDPVKAVPLLEALQGQAPAAAGNQTELYDLLSEAYLKANMPLEAAQALQTLSGLPGLPIDRRLDILRQAGDLFLQNAMPVQSVELGLKGLVQEKQELEKPSPPPLDPATGNTLRLMLAKAYQAQGDQARERIVLDDLLNRPALTTGQKAQVQIMLSGSQRRDGRISEAEQIYHAVAADPAAEANWRDSATQTQKMIEWNRKHPDHPIDLTLPPGKP